MVWNGRSLKDHLVPTPCHEQGHLLLDQAAQSSIQFCLKHFQDVQLWIDNASLTPGHSKRWNSERKMCAPFPALNHYADSLNVLFFTKQLDNNDKKLPDATKSHKTH